MMRYCAVSLLPDRIHSKQRTVIKMKNVTKILCVVLALVMALSAASCSLTKQYAYQKDDVELPIGVYIYYLQQAYNQAQQYAQQSDKYDADKGRYDGKKSFLKMEITPEEGEDPVVAEDWIKSTAEKNTKHAVAVMTKFKELGCTMDEAALDTGLKNFKTSWDKSDDDQQLNTSFLQYFGNTKQTFEEIGVSYESVYMVINTLPMMENEVFNAQYGTNGPSAVSDEEITTYLKDNYVSYRQLVVNLYTTSTPDETDPGAESASGNTPLSDEEIASYQSAFAEYASTLSDGGSFADVVAKYNESFGKEEEVTDPTVTKLEKDSTDEIQKTLKDMKDGQAMTVEIGEDENSKQLHLLYREKIEDQYESYTDPKGENKTSILKEMKQEDFEKLLDDAAEDIKLSSACNSYKPSMFESKKKKSNK